MNREFMRRLLVEESFAYGFTIAFWGSSMLLINRYGLLHAVGVLEYMGGAVFGFGVLALLTFGSVINPIEDDPQPRYFVLTGVHYLAGAVPVIATSLLIDIGMGQGVTLVLAGAGVSMLYNLSAALEEVVSEFMWQLEKGNR